MSAGNAFVVKFAEQLPFFKHCASFGHNNLRGDKILQDRDGMKRIWLTFFILLPAIAFSQFQNHYSLFERNTVITIDSIKKNYALPDSFLIINSEQIFLDSFQLRQRYDYQLNYTKGKISFLKQIPKGKEIQIYYKFLPLQIQQNYFHRELLLYNPELDSLPSTPKITPASTHKSPQVSSTLKQNGSIVRGISMGTNQGMKLESGLRMQISGKVANKIEVVAALSDQNTPIQPEGNTQSLQEIDKVFVQLKSDRFQATLGDYYFDLSGTEFSPYTRKLQGVMGTADFGKTKFTLSGAVSKGKFTTNKFLGQEGNQGPYQLKGDRGQIDIIVLAGTEKVWIDGEIMTRGEDNDYIIEYSNGQIEFTRHRLITADSRITIDFQYSDLKFQRSLYSADLTTRLMKEKIKFGVRLLRESDNKDNPLDYTLNDENRTQLELAGDDGDSAYVSGVRYVGHGKGYYVEVDSADIKFYRYVGADSGDYNISFSYFGTGQGDYKSIGYYHYKYVGTGQGSYKPIVLLTPAQSHDLIDLSLGYAPKKYFQFNTEMALSRLDQNLYSSIDDGDNTGIAATGGFRFNPDSLTVLGKNLGKLDLSGKYRRVQNRFRYISRTEEVEKNRKWDIEDASTQEENIVEFNGNYSPVKEMKVSGSWGENNKGGNFKSSRWQTGSEISFKKIPKINYRIESIESRNLISQRNGKWIRQKGLAEYKFWKLAPTVDYIAEEKKENYSDTLKLGFQYYQITPSLKLSNWKKMTLSVGLTKRKQDKYSNQGFLPESEALTQQVNWDFNGWKNFSMSAQYTHRERTYADSSIGSKMADLADFKLNFSPLKRAITTTWHYQLSNTQVAKQEKIYIKVERGQGNYRFDEDLNEYIPDGMTGDYILRVRATDDFVPVVELRASSKIKFQPALLWQTKKRSKKLSKWKKYLSSISTETFFRLEEKTREKDVWSIYRLELSKFQQDDVSILSTKNLRQDVYWNRNRSKYSVRLRLNIRGNLNNQYLEGGQQFNLNERSIRIKGQFTKKISAQIDAQTRHEEKLYKIPGRVNKDIFSNEISVDFSYRPRQKLELAIKSKWTNAENRAAYPIEVNFLALTPRVNYSFRGKGRLRAELEFNRVEVTPENAIIPYEMVSGNRGGTNLRWLTSFDYNVSRYIRASVSWNGRYEEYLGKPIYTVRAEMRAYF